MPNFCMAYPQKSAVVQRHAAYSWVRHNGRYADIGITRTRRDLLTDLPVPLSFPRSARTTTERTWLPRWGRRSEARPWAASFPPVMNTAPSWRVGYRRRPTQVGGLTTPPDEPRKGTVGV